MTELNNSNQLAAIEAQPLSTAPSHDPQEPIAQVTPPTTITSTETQVNSQLVGENNNRKHKKQLAVIGAMLLAIIIISTIATPLLKSFLVKQYPEMGYLPELLETIYPDAKFGVLVAFEQNNSVKTSAITVSATTKTGLTQSEINGIGSSVCSSLMEHNTNYDEVRIESIKETRFLFFSSSITQGKGATCDEWLENKL